MPYCNNCGEPFALGTAKCPNCDAVLPSPVSGNIAGIRQPLEAANPIIRRLVAAVIDVSLFTAIVAFVVTRKGGPILLLAARDVVLVFQIVYFLLKDAFEGKSFGKALTGVIVYNTKRKGYGTVLDSIIRNWPLALPILGPTVFASIALIQILQGKRQRIGEVGASTVVLADDDYVKFT